MKTLSIHNCRVKRTYAAPEKEVVAGENCEGCNLHPDGFSSFDYCETCKTLV